jgi:KipI family sensor histidine kinase inhibitor
VRIREAGDSTLILELQSPERDPIDPEINAHAIRIADIVRRRRIAGVRDVVPTFRSVAVSFDPLATDVSAVAAALDEGGRDPRPGETGRVVEVPVVYGGEAGPDLVHVAAFAGATPEAVVEWHAARTYRVFMLGFLPGFPYMAAVDDRIAAPRHPSPRVRVPAGSVGIAGRQTGVYPRESPGGWQIIGRTMLRMFDPEEDPPALLAPGDRVRFVPVRSPVVSGFSRTGGEGGLKADTAYERYITVLQPGLLTTIQDSGRWGYQHLGVPVSGPMDPFAHRVANALVGNPRDAATLEATVVGPEMRFEQRTRIAMAGADLHPTLDGSELAMETVVDCSTGSVLRFGRRRSGARVYIALNGGIAVPHVLGSRSTHVGSGLGGIAGRALGAGDRVTLGALPASSALRTSFKRPDVLEGRLRIMPGPQIEYFPPSALEALQRARFTISPQSDRMGYRLTGGTIPAAQAPGEMISDATVVGGVQVPPSGQPIVLMADRQTTGGYPQIAVVITADLSRAAQLAPGDSVAFEICSRSDAIAALAQQEGFFLDRG